MKRSYISNTDFFTKRINILFVVTLLFITLFPLYTENINAEEDNGIENNTISYNEVPAGLSNVNWMKELDDNIFLSDLSIPGTHDSSTYQVGMVNDSIACVQNHYIGSNPKWADWWGNISDQTTRGLMDRGFRHFDLRIKLNDDGDLILGHGIEDSRYVTSDMKSYTLGLETVYQQIVSFLKKNPSETIMIEISEENESGSSGPAFNYFKQKAEDWDSYIWSGDHIPTLGEVRGKIVIFTQLKGYQQGSYRIKDTEDMWAIEISNGWGKEKPYALQQKMVTSSFEVWGENHWDEVDKFVKKSYVINAITDSTYSAEAIKNRLAKENKKVWVFNYSTANWMSRVVCLSQCQLAPLFPSEYHKEIEPEIIKTLTGAYNNVFTGIIAFDFAEEKDAEAVWKTNYRRSFTPAKTYTVSFDSKGGYEVDDQKVIEGSKAKEVIPWKSAYPFLGWYIEGTNDEYDFSLPVNKDINLYAKWRWKSTDYIDQFGESHTAEKTIAIDKDYRSNWDASILESWITINNSYETSERIVVNGNINLIIPDNMTITANNGIRVKRNSSLTIWCQSGRSGTIDATITNNDFYNSATIGGSSQNNAGPITINGGKIYASSSGNGAAIGGGMWTEGESGAITINNGIITAISTGDGAAIGSGKDADGINILINNGTVTATSKNAAAIGKGIDERLKHKNSFDIIVNGGNVSADGAFGIGGEKANISIHGGNLAAVGTIGIGGKDSYITYDGGTITATAKDDGIGIGGTDSRINLSWEKVASNSIFSSKYLGSITLEKNFEYQGSDKELVSVPIKDNKTIIPGHDHILRKVERIAPTCEEDGVETYWICDECQKMYQDPQGTIKLDAPVILPKLGHDWYEYMIEKEPTCAEEGLAWDMCRNGLHSKQRTLPRTEDHVYGEATYTWVGVESLTGKRTCTLCGNEQTESATLDVWYHPDEPNCSRTVYKYVTAHFSEDSPFKDQQKMEVVPPQHNWGTPTYIWDESNSKVQAKAVCQTDSSHVITQIVDTTSQTISEPTCTEKGKKVYTATFTNAPFTTQTKEVVTAELGHDWSEWHDDEGEQSESRHCQRNNCDASETRNKPLTHKHSFDNDHHHSYVAPTCTENGNKEYWICTDPMCGRYFISNPDNPENKKMVDYADIIIPALGHNWGNVSFDWHVIENPIPTIDAPIVMCVAQSNCTRTGCQEKHIEGKQGVLDTSDERNRQATCIGTGIAVYKAVFESDWIAVGDRQQTNPVTTKALGHNYSEPEYSWSEDNTKATASMYCVREGCEETCEGHAVLETVNTRSVISKEATCEEKGETTYTAVFTTNKLFLKQVKTVDDIDSLDHDYDEPVYVWSSDNSKVIATKSCKRQGCSKVLSEQSTTSSTIIKNATCEEDGSLRYIAEFTGPDFETQTKDVVIEKLGHDYRFTKFTANVDEKNKTIISAKAEFVCNNDQSHQQQVDVEKYLNKQLSEDPVCETDGKDVWALYLSSSASPDKLTHIDKEYHTFIRARLGHNYGEPVYTWSQDNSSILAETVCQNDHTHIISETVNTSSEITKQPSETETGIRTYTGEFSDRHFTTQKKEVEIPKITKYPVILVVNGEETAMIKVEKGHIMIRPSDPQKKGHSFDGNWYKDKSKRTPEYRWDFDTDKVTGPTYLYADLIPNEYTLYLDYNDGSEIEEWAKIRYGHEYPELPSRKKGEYDLSVWYLSSDFKEDEIVNKGDLYRIDGDSTLVARYMFAVFFGGNNPFIEYVYEDQEDKHLTEPKVVPQMEGYRFDCWVIENDKNGEPFNFENDTPQPNMILMPRFYNYVCSEMSGTWVIGNSGTYRFRFTRNEFVTKLNPSDKNLVEDFEENGLRIYMDPKGSDDEPINRENYSYEEGSLIVNFKDSYFNSLSPGDHLLRIEFTDGSVNVGFTVKNKPDTPIVIPKTGIE